MTILVAAPDISGFNLDISNGPMAHLPRANEMHYRDLLNSDGTLNRSAFEGIVAACTEHEINLALIVDNSIKSPRHIGLREVAAWRAAQVALCHLDTLTARERAEIENRVRTEMLELFHSMCAVRAEFAATQAA